MRRLRLTAIAALLGLVLGWGIAGLSFARADGDDEAEAHVTEPVYVSPPRRPTEVEVALHMVHLTRVDEPSEPYPTFEAELFLDMRWSDPRLAFDAAEVGVQREVFLEHEADRELERIWWPDVEFENGQGGREIEAQELVIEPDGTVEYTERFHGTFTADVDLRRFPFDSQRFTIHLESFAWDEQSVVFVPLEDKMGVEPDLQTLEWEVDGVTSEIRSLPEVRSTRPFHALLVHVDAKRRPWYYLWKIVTPLLIIVMFNWSAFWMPGEAASTRLERAFIALLTVVAFHHIVAKNLPRISYLTFLDAIVYLAFAAVGLTMVFLMMAQRNENRGDYAAVRRLDRQARWLFPLGFVVALVTLWVTYH